MAGESCPPLGQTSLFSAWAFRANEPNGAGAALRATKGTGCRTNRPVLEMASLEGPGPPPRRASGVHRYGRRHEMFGCCHNLRLGLGASRGGAGRARLGTTCLTVGLEMAFGTFREHMVFVD